MGERQRRWLISAGALLAVLLPILFNPYASAPFEPVKVLLVRAVALGMLLVVLLPAGLRRLFPARSNFDPAGPLLLSGLLPWRAPHPLAKPVSVYAALLTLATFLSIDVKASLWGIDNHHGLVTMLAVLLFFYLLSVAPTRWDEISLIAAALILGSVPVALYGWVQYLGLDTLSWITMSISPVHSTLGRSVFLGAYLAMIIPFTLMRIATLRSPSRRERLGFYLILVLQLGCLIFTLARAAWLGFLGGGLVYAIVVSPRRRNYAAALGLLAILGALLFGFISLFGSTIFSPEAVMPPPEQFAALRSNSNSARMTTWRNALALLPDRWLLGYGPETFVIAVERRGFARESDLPSWHFLDDPHNVFLYQATAAGAAGLSAFLYLLARFYGSGWRTLAGQLSPERRRTFAAILGSSLAYLIQAQFTPDVITVQTLFWMNLALGVAAFRISKATGAS